MPHFFLPEQNDSGLIRQFGSSTDRIEKILKPEKVMAAKTTKPLTKSQIATEIAEATGITKKTAVEVLDYLAQLAYKQAKNSFTVPGIGKLVLVHRKARTGRNPQTGEAIKIAAKKVVKFRVAKACKDAILPPKK